MGNAASLTGQQVREIWKARFKDQGTEHPYWLYTHIPFCPQVCSYCQCSTALRKSDQEVATYLQWLEGEIDFLADASASGLAKFQYIGGGTPNLLSESQLEWLLGKLNQQFRFAPGSRRTFEFLPSALRPETLPLVRSFGFNRLSCGVQSWSGETLKAVNRSKVGLDQLGRTVQDAYDLGFDELNLDLIYGIGKETRKQFLEGLLHVSALRSTTVTIHNVIPTATNPVFATTEEELAAHAEFERLEESIGEAVARQFPHLEWVLRPNSWTLVDRRFRKGPEFSYWYYSDNERIHIDMLSFGRFAHSNILGQITYENLSTSERYNPEEASYRSFCKTPAVDAALDLITDLVGDRHGALPSIRERYGADALNLLQPVLERLHREGALVQRNGSWAPVQTDGVFIDPLWPLLETAMRETVGSWSVPMSAAKAGGIRLGAGGHSLEVFIEQRKPDKPYFSEMGNLGIYYRAPGQGSAADQSGWVEELMGDFLVQVGQLLEEIPGISAKAATARLHRYLS